MPYDEKLAKRVRRALKGTRGLSEKKMFGGICFLLRGNMLGGIVKNRLVVRLAKDKAKALLKEKHVRPMDLTGRPLAGFLFVLPPAVKDARNLKKWLGLAVAHAKTLPSKI